MVPSHRRTPPESLTPRAKTHKYLNLIVANQEIHAIDPSAWAILLDTNGNLCEGLGSNIFVVRHGAIFTPREKYVLPGVSRQTAIDLAHEARLTVTEADLDLYDAYCRRDFHHLDLSVLVPGGVGERSARGAGGSGVGADHQETRRCLYPVC